MAFRLVRHIGIINTLGDDAASFSRSWCESVRIML